MNCVFQITSRLGWDGRLGVCAATVYWYPPYGPQSGGLVKLWWQSAIAVALAETYVASMLAGRGLCYFNAVIQRNDL